MKIDVISDAVCPWCYIGKRNLEQALAQRPDIEADVHWHPYQLHPDAPAGGYDYRATIEQKYGREAIARMFAHITQVGAAAGIAFHLDRISRGANTLDAHRLLYWARAAGVQNQVCEAIFEAYFGDGRDLGDPETLVAIAAANGLDGADIRARLASAVDRDKIEELRAFAAGQGVSGVPLFIIDGVHTLSGAQGVETFLSALDRVAAKGAGQTCAPDGCLRSPDR